MYQNPFNYLVFIIITELSVTKIKNIINNTTIVFYSYAFGYSSSAYFVEVGKISKI
ncbi:hypothetical protein UT300002_31630 [Clostridium perfringens]